MQSNGEILIVTLLFPCGSVEWFSSWCHENDLFYWITINANELLNFEYKHRQTAWITLPYYCH